MLMTSTESILYARVSDDIVVIRVTGRGNHQNSLSLREVQNLTAGGDRSPTYILDLEKCATMDSTFMGVLASIALRQQRSIGTRPVIVNVNDHVRGLLNNLGLKFILDMRGTNAPGVEIPLHPDEYSSVETPEVNKVNRIILMIEAHEKLIDIHSENEVQFKGVLQSLRESLERTRGSES